MQIGDQLSFVFCEAGYFLQRNFRRRKDSCCRIPSGKSKAIGTVGARGYWERCPCGLCFQNKNGLKIAPTEAHGDGSGGRRSAEEDAGEMLLEARRMKPFSGGGGGGGIALASVGRLGAGERACPEIIERP
ncbi:MAG: hypothetical protein ACREJ2_16410 [Planctomycetota bacterium]